MLKRAYLLIALTCFFTESHFGQQTSQKKIIKKAILETFKTLKYAKNKNASVKKLKETANLASSFKLDTLLIESMVLTTQFNIKAKDSILVKKDLKNLEIYFTTKKSALAKGEYFFLKGLNYYTNNIIDSSYVNYLKAQKIFMNNALNKNALKVLFNIIKLQYKLTDKQGLENTAITAISIAKKENNYGILSLIYSYIGLVNGRSNLKKAEDYFKKAISYNYKNNDSLDKQLVYASIYRSCSYIYIYHYDYKKIISYANKSLETINKYRLDTVKKSLLISALQNLAIGEEDINDYSKSLNKLLKASELCDSGGQELEEKKAGVLYDIATMYLNHNKKKVGLKYLNQSLKLSRKYKNKDLESYCLYILANISKPKEAVKYYENYVSLNDSLYYKKANLKDDYAFVKFETKQKEIENQLLRQENIAKNAQIQNVLQKNKITRLVVFVCVLLIIFIITFYFLRQKSLNYKINLEKAEVREQVRRNIASTLHDKVVGDLRLIHERALKNNVKEISDPLFKVNEEIRSLSHKLSSVDFKDVSFKDQIINLVSDYFSPKFKITLKNINKISWNQIEPPIKRALYLVIREAIQNSKKHASATKLIIYFKIESKKLQVEITDNGKGFDISSPKYGLGLKNQKKRVEELNGFFNLKSVLDQGTTTMVKFPLKA